MSDHLTDQSYWDKVWTNNNKGSRTLGIRATLRHWSMWKTRSMFSKLLSKTGLDEADVFEIGCAPGTKLLFLKELRPGYRLHGIDFAEEGVEIAKRRFEALGIDAEVFLGDVREFPVHQKYDLVVSHGLVEHFTDVEDIISHHKRFVKPGGYILITMPNYTHPIVRFFIKRFDPTALEVHNLETMNKDFLFEVLCNTGFKNVNVGWDGGPKLRSVAAKRDLPSRIYLLLSRIWNLLAGFLPRGVGWQSTIWGIGQLPHSS